MKTKALFLAIILLSCSDEKEYCFVCTTTTFIAEPGVSHPATTSSVKYCGLTQEEADEKEEKGTSSTYYAPNATTEKRTECVKR